MRFLFAICGLTLLAGGCQGLEPELSKTRSAIEGGSLEYGEPNVVMLVKKDEAGAWQMTCTGTMVGHDVVLTAQHCLWFPGITQEWIQAGNLVEWIQAGNLGIQYGNNPPIGLKVVPVVDGTLAPGPSNDVALLKLEKPLSEYWVGAAAVPEQVAIESTGITAADCSDPNVGPPSKHVGYGYDHGGVLGSWGVNGVKRSGMSTSTLAQGTTCGPVWVRSGDSGGPVFHDSEAQRRIIGTIISTSWETNEATHLDGSWLSCWVNDQIIALSDEDTSWIQTCAWCGNGVCEAAAGECDRATFCAEDCCPEGICSC
ncbi:MAG: trypsin-like serine protease [Deltaproteobacteria bacterium]|nr:trypsin-like serine protease [Deltaproteobacteria bacterium]